MILLHSMRYLSLFVFLFALIPLALIAQVNFSSSNLPVMVIDTHGAAILNEPKIIADMGIINNGPDQRNNLTDPFNDYSGKIGIELRGSSSQMFPKKPYGFELRDAGDNAISASLLGMPAEEDWVLIATYNDKTLIRDALAYRLARDMGRYGARTRFVELIFRSEVMQNGEPTFVYDYQGIYMLAEKIKRDNNRVNISKLEPIELSGDDVTGGYILKVDKTSGNSGAGFFSAYPPSWRSGNQVIEFQYEYPSYDKIANEQKIYIQNYIKQFEKVLSSDTYDDEVNGYAKYIDVDSFIDFLIVNEVSRNVDGYRLSTFLYKDKDSDDGKLTMGPVWDFNLAFGNADYCSGSEITGWAYDFNSVCNSDYWLVPFWWRRLLTDSNFKQKLALRWQELRAGKLMNSEIFSYVDSLSNVLKAEATQRNFAKWPVLGHYVWPNQFVGPTYESEIEWMKEWINSRMLWLDMKMPQVVTAADGDEDNLLFYASPNPFDNEFEIQYSLRRPGGITVEIVDPLGKQVLRSEANHREAGDFVMKINTINFQEGLYIIKATTPDDVAVQRVVRQK
jgi:hypothetical protein